MNGFPLPLFLICTTRPSRALCLPLFNNFPFLVRIDSPILLPLVLLPPPRRVDLLVLPTEKERKGRHIAASPSILVVLSICRSARNTAHVGNLYPASSNSPICLVSFRIVAITACSLPSLLLFQKVSIPGPC